MKDVLLPIGTNVVATIENNEEKCMIIGHRIINPCSMRAWDYIAVPFPAGFERHFNKEKQVESEDFYYFNHIDIERILREEKQINKEPIPAELNKPMLVMPKMDGEKTTTGISVYVEQWERWKKFKEQHNQYSGTDLLAMALQEFMDKYGPNE